MIWFLLFCTIFSTWMYICERMQTKTIVYLLEAYFRLGAGNIREKLEMRNNVKEWLMFQ